MTELFDFLSAMLDKQYDLHPREKDVLMAIIVRCGRAGQNYAETTVTQLGRDAGGLRVDYASTTVSKLLERNVIERVGRGFRINHPSAWKRASNPTNGLDMTPNHMATNHLESLQTVCSETPNGLATNGLYYNPFVPPKDPVVVPISGDPLMRVHARDHESHDHDHETHEHDHEISHGEDSVNATEGTPNADRPGGTGRRGSVRRDTEVPAPEPEAFPDELEWVLRVLKVRSLNDLQMPSRSKLLRTYREYCSLPPQYRLYGHESCQGRTLEKPLAYAVASGVSKMKQDESIANGGDSHGQTNRGSGGSGFGASRGVPPGGHRDWDAELREAEQLRFDQSGA